LDANKIVEKIKTNEEKDKKIGLSWWQWALIILIILAIIDNSETDDCIEECEEEYDYCLDEPYEYRIYCSEDLEDCKYSCDW
jgi:hypothetical protein